MAATRTRHPDGDPRTTDELVRTALLGDDDEAWACVEVLHLRGGRGVFQAARRLLSGEVRERMLGADILGQLGTPERPFIAESFDLLAPLLTREREPAVIAAVVTALGHLEASRRTCLDEGGAEADLARTLGERHGEAVLTALTHLAHHPDADVRCATAWSLPFHTVAFDDAGSRSEDPRGVAALETLAQDGDEDVRDHALFGLGMMLDVDTPDVRDALAARLDDDEPEARHEAILGLARRGDDRAVAPLVAALSQESVWLLAVEAALALGDHRLREPLTALRPWWGVGTDDAALLESAIAACGGDPASP